MDDSSFFERPSPFSNFSMVDQGTAYFGNNSHLSFSLKINQLVKSRQPNQVKDNFNLVCASGAWDM